jgi:hypothetical protein
MIITVDQYCTEGIACRSIRPGQLGRIWPFTGTLEVLELRSLVRNNQAATVG